MVVVHNGIIENYITLKKRLAAQGHKFVTETDTEIVAHLIEEHIKKLLENPALSEEQRTALTLDKTAAGAMDGPELHATIHKYRIVSDKGNALSEPYPFNLMFETAIGPTGKLVGFLRPETAQGIFVNFRRLLEFNAGRMPFAAAQIGPAFRNEISPRSGLIRVREFTLAEIEHFVDPDDKSHPKFKSIAELRVNLLDREEQKRSNQAKLVSFGDAVKQKIINNETLAYFMARTWLFLVSIGIKSSKLRFRQHKAKEMAHYAADCWDAEIKSSYDWVECVGHADRACYDLSQHSNRSHVDLIAQKTLAAPELVKETRVLPNKGMLGKTLRGDAQKVIAVLEGMNSDQAAAFGQALQQGAVTIKGADKEYKIDSTMCSVQTEEKKVSVRKYIPSVIEPSFGLGRILYQLLEHAFYYREGSDKQTVFKLPPVIAPYKASILPLSSGDHFDTITEQLVEDLLRLALPTKTDHSTVSIGRKYARSDELGTPFAVTIDFESKTDNCVTIRERDSCNQIRVAVAEASSILFRLCNDSLSWEEAYHTYPQFTVEAEADEQQV